MAELNTDRTQRNADRLLRGGSHPVLAIAAFFGAFLFAALPFVFDRTTCWLSPPGLMACFSCSILFMRLLIGELGLIKWILLGVAAYLGYIAAEQWYLIALLAGGTLVCSFLIARLVGDFVPVVAGVKCLNFGKRRPEIPRG